MNFIKNTLIIIITIIAFLYMFFQPIQISFSITNALKLWTYRIIPSIFPILVFSSFLINYNISDYIGFIVHKPFKFLYHSPNKETSFVIFISLIAGTPTSTKLISDLYKNNLIDEEYARYLFNNFSTMNILFIISIVGLLVFNDIKIGLLILFSNLLVHLVVAFFCKPKLKYFKSNNKNNIALPTALVKSIESSVNVLINVLGAMLFFSILIYIVKDLNVISNDFIGILEITQGIDKVTLNYSFKLIVAFTSSLVCFLGLSIHIQSLSIMNFKTSYSRFILMKLIISVLVFFTSYLII